MRFTPDNFLYMVKQLVTGKNGAGTGTAKAADGGVKVDKYVPLSAVTNGVGSFPAITDSTGGTPSTTFAAIAAGATYLQGDLVAIKNALAEIAAVINAQNDLTDSSKVPAIVIPAGTNQTVGIISVPVPRDYDEASDNFALRIAVQSAVNDGTTLTATATITPIATGTPVDKSAVNGTAPFKTATLAVTTTEQVVDFNLSGFGLKRDDLISITIKEVGTSTSTGDKYLWFEYHFDSTVVSYNETDATGDPDTGGNLVGFGNALR